jgi:DNA-binding transcriptional LysR family regulator
MWFMSEIDLNLLRVFDALFEMRSVTRVADRLGLTQSAVSHALGRLRRMMDDPLFIRSPRGLQPSARAEQIAPGVRASLQQLRDALAPPRFDPASATRRFTVAAGAYFCTLIVPVLFEHVRQTAPGVSLRVVPLIENGTAMLDRGTIDLALSGMQEVPSRFMSALLFREDMVWIARRTGALAHGLAGQVPSLAQVLRQPRVRIATHRQFTMHDAVASDLAEVAEQIIEWNAHPAPHALATVYDSRTAVAIVARTDMVACVSRRIAERAMIGHDITVLRPAAQSDALNLAMTWHRRHDADAGFGWLRGLIATIAGQI